MPPFQRDRFTWLAYFMLGYYAYLLNCIGPILTFLQTELKLDYTTTNFHLSAFALGMTGAGVIGDRLAQRFGQRFVFWVGGAGMALGATLLAIGGNVFVTVGATLIMGFIGSWLLVMIQATLADRHGEQRAIALTESNIFASVTSALAPLLVGGLARMNLGWRGALIAGVISWVILFFFLRDAPFPQSRAVVNPTTNRPSGKLPPAFWVYWLVVLLVVAVEWCTIAWGADFLTKEVGFAQTDAATMMTVFFVAMIIGRATGSQLTRRFASENLLFLALIIAAVGFPIFWLSSTPILNVLGLFITGLGVSNLFPLTLSTASRVASANANAASARVSMGSGLAILITPQLLATVADQIGIQRAYTVVAVLLVLGLIVTFSANRFARRDMNVQEAPV